MPRPLVVPRWVSGFVHFFLQFVVFAVAQINRAFGNCERAAVGASAMPIGIVADELETSCYDFLIGFRLEESIVAQ